MHMHAGDTRLHGADEVPIEGGRQVGMDPALHADLARAGEPRLLGPIGHLVQREGVGLRIDLALGERAEAATDVADVREVDVAVADVGDLGTDRLGPEVVGHTTQRVQRLAVGPEQRQRLVVGDRRVRARPCASASADLGVDPCWAGRARRPRPRVTALSFVERPVDRLGVIAQARRRRPSRTRARSSAACTSSSGSCHATGAGRVLGGEPVGTEQRVDRRPHRAGEPGIGLARRTAGRSPAAPGAALPRAAVVAASRSICGHGRSGLTWSGVIGETPPQSLMPASRSRSRCVSSDRLGGACTLTCGPITIRATATAARNVSSDGLGRVVHRGPRLRPEVLDDHLLDVVVAAVQVADREERRRALARGLADPDEDPGGERDREPPGVLDRAQPHRRHLVGRPVVRAAGLGQTGRSRSRA